MMRSGVQNSTPLQIGTDIVEQVPKFTYLDSVVSETGGTEQDISSLIASFKLLRPERLSRSYDPSGSHVN